MCSLFETAVHCIQSFMRIFLRSFVCIYKYLDSIARYIFGFSFVFSLFLFAIFLLKDERPVRYIIDKFHEIRLDETYYKGKISSLVVDMSYDEAYRYSVDAVNNGHLSDEIKFLYVVASSTSNKSDDSFFYELQGHSDVTNQERVFIEFIGAISDIKCGWKRNAIQRLTDIISTDLNKSFVYYAAAKRINLRSRYIRAMLFKDLGEYSNYVTDIDNYIKGEDNEYARSRALVDRIMSRGYAEYDITKNEEYSDAVNNFTVDTFNWSDSKLVASFLSLLIGKHDNAIEYMNSWEKAPSIFSHDIFHWIIYNSVKGIVGKDQSAYLDVIDRITFEIRYNNILDKKTGVIRNNSHLLLFLRFFRAALCMAAQYDVDIENCDVVEDYKYVKQYGTRYKNSSVIDDISDMAQIMRTDSDLMYGNEDDEGESVREMILNSNNNRVNTRDIGVRTFMFVGEIMDDYEKNFYVPLFFNSKFVPIW